jgi:NADH-quinone oxidoreductase subunit M
VLLTGDPRRRRACWRPGAGTGPAFFGLLFLVLQGSALGVFLALDFFHWFIFWELSLIPAYFLIKLWGGPGARAPPTSS